ncbi:hypothetical protein DCAR_0104406 [Daucus carota subsp. sativus]|uniref:Bromo domain-containing protein n=1 Tax=Daucus carota subsp. sativus TaxID=79200 RepID=A0AAF0WBF5_DAUCS|nr:PREDICTED: uncharacterized protein LOC108220906 [Daucus carota subsp. sativus]WOG85218.1 hypothetical protein DCAR_0104406 [Daucus carota subsp. sativus]
MREGKIAVGPRLKWGTWEELVLGSAVLRHGNKDWNVIASELRVRTVYPFSFTPEACKAKYKDLRRRYSGCKAWFEELRRCRMKELKLELKKTAESIGSLEAKLKRLKTSKKEDCEVDYDTSRTESPEPVPKTELIDYSAKETSKDSLSAGSYTQDFRSSFSPDCRITELESTPEMETRPKRLESDEHETLMSIKIEGLMNEKVSTVRKRRGKRKRKDCNMEIREGSIAESEHFHQANVQTISSWKETSTSGCGQIVKSSSVDGHNKDLFRGTSGGLMGFFSVVAESKHALVFKRRLDGQKRARYKRIIRQHMDLDTIKSRIDSGTIKSIKELFRDLLLLANNALIFYSKRTREYKSAFSLRELLMKEIRQQCRDSLNISSSIVHFSPMCSTPVRPRSFRPRPEKSKFSAKPTETAGGVAGTLLGNKRVGDASPSTPSLALQSSVMARKSPGAPQGYLKLRHADTSSTPLGSLTMAKKHVGISVGSKKPNNADSNLPKQSMPVAKKGVSPQGKIVRPNSNNHRSKTVAMKERKRAGQKITGL